MNSEGYVLTKDEWMVFRIPFDGENYVFDLWDKMPVIDVTEETRNEMQDKLRWIYGQSTSTCSTSTYRCGV